MDLRVEMLDKKGCQGRDSEKEESCFNAQEVAVFFEDLVDFVDIGGFGFTFYA